MVSTRVRGTAARLRRTFSTRRLASVAAGAVFVWLASAFAVDWALLHRRGPRGPERLPPALAGRAVELRLVARDGVELGAWWLAAPDARCTALVLHGNSGSRSHEVETMLALERRGISSLALTLRAHGDSDGEENDLGWSARHDVVCALDEIERRAPGAPVVVVGHSLGAAAALYSAAETHARIDAWWLDAPYRDLASAVRHRLACYLPPLFDDLAWLGMRLWAGVLLEPRVQDLDPLACVQALPRDEPVVFLAGSADRFAPLADTRALHAAAGPGAELVVCAGRGHVELFAVERERCLAALERVLARAGIAARRIDAAGADPHSAQHGVAPPPGSESHAAGPDTGRASGETPPAGARSGGQR